MTDFKLNDIVEVNGDFPNPEWVGHRGLIIALDTPWAPGQAKQTHVKLLDRDVILYVHKNEIDLIATSTDGSEFSADVDELVEGLHGSIATSDTYDAARWYGPSDSKPTNPKDAIGSTKLPISLWPETATALGCLGLLEGALKYGRLNWREAGVRASIYVDALRRHMAAWFEGEDEAPDSGLPHLAHALACLAILVDAQAAGKLVDDRQFSGAGYRPLVESLTPHVARLIEKYESADPKHYTIQDNSRTGSVVPDDGVR